jgi:hypothetical protein
METPRFGTVPCRVCYAKTLHGNDRRPSEGCGRCGAPYDAATSSFTRDADVARAITTPVPRLLLTIRG